MLKVGHKQIFFVLDYERFNTLCLIAFGEICGEILFVVSSSGIVENHRPVAGIRRHEAVDGSSKHFALRRIALEHIRIGHIHGVAYIEYVEYVRAVLGGDVCYCIECHIVVGTNDNRCVGNGRVGGHHLSNLLRLHPVDIAYNYADCAVAVAQAVGCNQKALVKVKHMVRAFVGFGFAEPERQHDCNGAALRAHFFYGGFFGSFFKSLL